jgi:tetratricopeptide (TPR) repeat protein
MSFVVYRQRMNLRTRTHVHHSCLIVAVFDFFLISDYCMNRITTCFRRSTVVFVFACVACSVAWAQPEAEQRKLRLAQSYEQSGDFRNAARVYQELYSTNKQAPVYFDGAVRSLIALGNPAAALPLVEEYLQSPTKASDERLIELHALRGELLWRTGKTTQASEAWQKALAMASASPQRRDSTYLKIAFSQANNRAFDAAIATLTKGRADLNAPMLFSDQLSQLYGAAGNYEAGTQEVLTLLRLQGAQNVARGRLSAYLINEQGISKTRGVLDRAATTEPNNAPLQRLYSWLLREIKDYDRALDITDRLDKITNAQGRELYEFAEAARRDGVYTPALKAFGMIIDKGKRNPYALSALYGYARTAESKLTESAASATSIAASEVLELIERYTQIARDYPNTEPALSAQYRIATLTHEALRKPEQAISEFDRLMMQYRALPPPVQITTQSVAAQGGVDLGTLYIELQRLPEAEQAFNRVLATFPGAQEERDEALYHLAELEYYRCALDSARERFGRLAVNPNADIANDALEMISLLEYQDTPAGKTALCELAKADLQAQQNKTDAAVSAYTALAATIAPNAKEASIGEQALLRAGKLERARKRWDAAVKLFTDVLSIYPEGTSGDDATLAMADCYAAQGKKEEAIQTYTIILVKYPRSTLVQEARMKIRKLRGDA